MLSRNKLDCLSHFLLNNLDCIEMLRSKIGIFSSTSFVRKPFYRQASECHEIKKNRFVDQLAIDQMTGSFQNVFRANVF